MYRESHCLRSKYRIPVNNPSTVAIYVKTYNLRNSTRTQYSKENKDGESPSTDSAMSRNRKNVKKKVHNSWQKVKRASRGSSDKRYNRVIAELKSTKDLLIKEQERIAKIESIKNSLEVDVRNLQIRIEKLETIALAGGRRVATNLESREGMMAQNLTIGRHIKRELETAEDRADQARSNLSASDLVTGPSSLDLLCQTGLRHHNGREF